MFQPYLCYYEPSLHQTKCKSIRRSLTFTVTLLTCLLLRCRRCESIRDFEDTPSWTRWLSYWNSSVVRLQFKCRSQSVDLIYFCPVCASTLHLTSCVWIFLVNVHMCVLVPRTRKQAFTTNKVELRFVCCVALGHVVSPHHTHFLPITVCHLSPPPLPLPSLLRLVGSSLDKLLFTLSNLPPNTPPAPPFKASSLVLHLLFLLENLTHPI